MTQRSLFHSDREPLNLRPYQKQAVDSFFDRVVATTAVGGIVRMPTGTGKTVVGSAIIDEWLEIDYRHRVLVLCHERQLVQQFAAEIESLLGRKAHVDMAEQTADATARLTVACRATYLARDTGDGDACSRAYKFDPLDDWLIICDEAHRYKLSLKSCGHLFEHFAVNPHSKRLGLTATPERGDGVSLLTLFPVVVQDYRYYDSAGGPSAITEGFAVPFDQRFVEVKGVDFKNLREVAGDFDENELEQVLTEQETLASLCEPTKELVGDRRTIVFNATVSMARRVADYFNAKAGYVVAKAIDGTTHDDERRSVYAAHQNGRFQFLCVCGLCREGYNDPGVGAIAVFRPTKSRGLAEQMKGRGSRPLRGVVDGLETSDERIAAIAASAKPDCLIVDLVGITGLAGSRSCLDIFLDGVPDEVAERAHQILEERQETTDPRQAISKAESEIAVEKVEQRAREQQEAERRAKLEANVKYLAVRVGDGHGMEQRFPLGDDSPTEKQWNCLLNNGLPLRPGMSRQLATRVIGMFFEGRPVQDICYHCGMSMQDIQFVPATAKQLWKLRKLGITPPPRLSKRQASKMIDEQLKARD